MSSDVWVVWPSASPERSLPMIDKWHEMGYKVAVLVNPPHEYSDLPSADMVIVQKEWVGFPTAANILCREVPGNVVAVAGDDIYPDPDKTAQEISQLFLQRFPERFGIMQPTGDKFAHTHLCAVSPWIGRAFIEKAYDGKGPFWEEYFHYFCDGELQEYAMQLGVFYQRDDLVQFHDHWQRQDQPKRPQYLRKAKRRWQKDKEIFDSRKKKGFPSNGTD